MTETVTYSNDNPIVGSVVYGDGGLSSGSMIYDVNTLATRNIPTLTGTQYGTLDTPITFTGDFETESIIATVSAAATFQTIMADLTSFDNYIDYKPSTNQLRVKLGGGTGVFNTPSFSINDGKVHTVLVSVVSGVATVSIDGEVQASTITVGANPVDFGLIGAATGAVNLYNGQILSTVFTDKSGAEDVITNYVFDSGSTVEQYARGSDTLKVTFTAFTSANWNRYTLQRNIIHDAGTIVEAWVGDDVVVNGRFGADTDWTKNPGWTIGGGAAIATAAAQFTGIEQIPPTTLTDGVFISGFTISDYSSGAYANMSGGFVHPSHAANGSYVDIATITSITQLIRIRNLDPAAGNAKIDNVSVQHLLEVA